MIDYSLYLVTDRIDVALADNAADIIRAGADGVAVVSAIVRAPCPASADTVNKKQVCSAR